MTFFVVHYHYDARSQDRDAIRPAHRAFLGKLYEAGDLLAVGPYGDSADPGALVILRSQDPEAAAALLDSDPFYLAGLIPRREVRAWTQVYGPFEP